MRDSNGNIKKYENKHYVYIWYYKNETNDEWVPFYVGRGKGSRYTASGHKSEGFKYYYENYECKVEFVKENISLEESEKLETKLIEEYGREFEGGILVNVKSGGGYSNLGKKLTNEQYEKQMQILDNIRNNPELEQKRITRMKEAQQSKIYRKRLSESLKKAYAKGTEINRRESEAAKKRMETDPVYRERVMNMHKFVTEEGKERSKQKRQVWLNNGGKEIL